MILLDTHIGVWWVHADPKLPEKHIDHIKKHEDEGLGISAITCWKAAKLVELNRLALNCPIKEWFEVALNYPGITFLELTPTIAIESTQLRGRFHRDPADQIIVATARIHDLPILTTDKRIIRYQHVKTL